MCKFIIKRHRSKKLNLKSAKRAQVLVYMAVFATIGVLTLLITKAAPGGCSTTGTLGTATYPVTVNEASTFKLWVRMQIPETTNTNNTNGVRVELNGASTQCFVVTTTNAGAVNQWQWVNSDATAAGTAHITSQMTAGSYTAKILGLKAGVKVDKVILLPSSSNCVPSNDLTNGQPGDNCTTPAPTVNLTANPSSVFTGTASTLTWSSTNSTSCIAGGGWSDLKTTSGTTSTGNLTVNTSFTLTCSGIGGSGSASRTVNVTTPPLPTVTLTALPSTVVSGNVSTLTWTASNATACTAGNGWSGDKSTSGGSQSTGNITATRSYTLTCTGQGGSANASATVTVTPPPVTDTDKPIVQMNIPGVTIPTGSSSVVVNNQKSISWQPLASDSSSAIKSLITTVNNQPATLQGGAITVGVSSNGDYILNAVATDMFDNVTTSTITVKIRHADINRSGKVDIFDMSALLNQWGAKNNTIHDINADGTVNIFDLSALLNRWNSTN